MPKVYGKNKLFMRQYIGTFETEGYKGTLNVSMTGQPIIMFENGLTVFIEWDELLNLAVKALEDQEEEGNGKA